MSETEIPLIGEEENIIYVEGAKVKILSEDVDPEDVEELLKGKISKARLIHEMVNKVSKEIEKIDPNASLYVDIYLGQQSVGSSYTFLYLLEVDKEGATLLQVEQSDEDRASGRTTSTPIAEIEF